MDGPNSFIEFKSHFTLLGNFEYFWQIFVQINFLSIYLLVSQLLNNLLDYFLDEFNVIFHKRVSLNLICGPNIHVLHDNINPVTVVIFLFEFVNVIEFEDLTFSHDDRF